ncbi:hypothetical protein F5X68DRAFT_229424 [Plectosphaerella plurivora]|uniref:Uncharacterized protein n=1 Tax=Plectosphaerella plurivora TaxID=936078 RepID=A0A9P8VH57_9PEZI|nr:hypothetical protein F5X68DRAFT_229424 [Plectosphaerella plurivora]
MTRFVQSNKKACFLCNLLLTLNGFPVIPKSHGKLYPGWRIPMLAVMEPLQLQLNTLLAQVYQESIALLVLKQKKVDLPYPYESSALSMSDVAASEVTQIVSDNSIAISPPGESKQSLFAQILTDRENSSEESEEPVSSPLFETDAAGIEDASPQAPPTDNTGRQEPTSPHESTEESEKEMSAPVSETAAADMGDIEEASSRKPAPDDPDQQEPTRLRTEPLWTTTPGQAPLVHTIGDSTLMVEYSIGPEIPRPKTLQYQIKTLSSADTQQLRDTSAHVVAVKDLEEGSEDTLCGTLSVYLDFGNAIAELILYN